MRDEGPRGAAQDRWLINAGWLVRLRWVAVVGQVTTIAIAMWAFRAELPTLPLLGIISLTTLTNLVFAAWLRTRRMAGPSAADRIHLVMAGILAIDLLSLTGLLYYSGGPANPFAVFYFVNLSLAAVIVPARWSWGLTVLAVGCFGGLLMNHIPMRVLDQSFGPESLFPGSRLQHVGLTVALIACGGVVTYFITRVTRELHQRETELRDAEQRRARSERLESLATLAAGAGHELASPLSTIAVIAKDLARHLEGTNAAPSVLEDVALIRGELDQCRRILDGMASGAGQALGEALQPAKIATLVDEVMEGLRRREHVSVMIPEEVAALSVFVPLTGMSHAIRGIVRNALDASSFGEPVEFAATSDSDSVAFTVRDRGPGMPPEVLNRAGDPFFTTKEPGKGMGLGLFLARNVIERIGGDLRLVSTPGTGTTVTIRLPQRPTPP